MSFSAVGILVVLFLVVLNGVFAMSEMAIVSARKTRLHQWAEEGNTKARAALDLANSPNLFLPTIQIGITLVGVMTGAFGGAAFSERLATFLAHVPFLARYSETIALVVVVLLITYLSLVIGELVPKRLALNHPEKTASLVAVPMRVLAGITSPVVRFLNSSTEVVLRILGVRPSAEPPITEEEIKLLIDQGTSAGVFEEAEQEIVERVFRMGDRRVGVLMNPRKKIAWLDINDPPEKIRRKMAKSPYSRFPVSQGRLGNILGLVHARDLLTQILTGRPFDLKAALRQPLFVPENMHVFKVMELFKESGMAIALVIDEYGTIEGIVTLNDILESILGDFPSIDEPEEPKVVQREDGSWLVDGMLPADELKELFHIRRLPGERAGHYQTLGGFVMTYMKRIPSAGDHFECCGWRFEIMDMDGHRVDKVLLEPVQEKSK